MIDSSDFNYAYVAGRLLDGANGMEKEKVISDIKSISDVLGDNPVDDMLRKIPGKLEEVDGEEFKRRCSEIRNILIKGLDPKDYDLNAMFEYDRLCNEDEE